MNKSILTLILLISSAAIQAENKWTSTTTKEGIDVYSRKSVNSSINSLRAEGVIHAKVGQIVAILRDVNSATDWVPNLVQRRYVEHISDREAILYDVSEMPWPVKDRDLVVHHKLSISADNKFLILNFKSVKHNSKKEGKDRVRAQIHFGKIEFFPKGNQTFVRLEMLVDPMGKIPKWVVNFLQVKMPSEFLIAMNKFSAKTTLKPLPGIQELIDQLIRE